MQHFNAFVFSYANWIGILACLEQEHSGIEIRHSILKIVLGIQKTLKLDIPSNMTNASDSYVVLY